MSMQALNDFAAALRGDEEMAQGLAAAIGDKQGGEGMEAFVAFAQQRGFTVTTQDVEELRQAEDREGVLSDNELDAVSGAGFFSSIFDIINKIRINTFDPVPLTDYKVVDGNTLTKIT